jgi:hypothetical protein
MDSQDSPWPKLGGSHHLPPYSIFNASKSTNLSLYTNNLFAPMAIVKKLKVNKK